MAEQSPGIQFEDIPLDEAHRMGRGPRMDPLLYDALKQKIQSPSLSTHAARIQLGEDITRTTMKNRILRVAAELRIPVTVRRVPGGLLFWRSTDEDIQQAREIAERLQGAQRRRPRTRPSRRRRPS